MYVFRIYTGTWMTEDLVFDSQERQGIYFFFIASRPALGLNQPPTQWVTGAFPRG
jgi:hypothetical protein